MNSPVGKGQARYIFQDGGGVPQDVVLGLAEDIERPTLELLEPLAA